MPAFRFRHALAALGLGAVLAAPVQAQPSDIDLYSGYTPTGDRPNVLLMLDSSANWNPRVGGNCFFKDGGVANGQPTDQGTKYAVELCALYNTIDALPLASDGSALFNVGIMLTNASPDSNKGGYPLVAFTPLDAAGKTKLKAAIRAIANTPVYKANASSLSLMLHEAYLYFKGERPRTGNLNAFYDPAAFSGGRYVSPSTGSCGRNYAILIANGPPDSGENTDAQALLNGLGGAEAVALIGDPAQGVNEANYADEYARFMRRADVSGKEDVQGIVTHTVAVVSPTMAATAPEKAYRAYARSSASWGGGSYYETSETDTMVVALMKIFSEMQAVNSVFASASLPVAVNARGTYLNQVFLGMFRPDGSSKPRWRGNLKQYRFGIDGSGNVYLRDAAGNAAVSAATGFVTPSAVSYWTGASTFWSAEPMGTPASESDSPDGEVVEKGGAAQRLRTTYATSQASRRVYTCIGCAAGTTLGAAVSTQFIDGNAAITTGMLGAADASERTAIIDFIRGTNNAGEIGPVTSPATTIRPSVHGDVLHSRPAVLNYGGSTGVVVFYGANDGLLHAINGNTGGSGAGEELWSFAPRELLGGLKRLRDNSPIVRLSTTPPITGATPRDYFVDGPIGVYLRRGTTGVERAIIFVSLRRGGRVIYALDVTDPTAPRFLWQVTPAAAGMGQLGQTWSEPRVTRVKGQTDPVVIFGGGYDPAEDSGGAATMGKAVFVLNAYTGALLRSFTALNGVAVAESIGRPVPADVTLVDSDYDGLVDRAYAADLGGQVYRIDFEGAGGSTLAAADWTIFKVADLSGGTLTGRKFFYAPDVVLTRDFTALMLGSGDREKPMLTATQDHFFQVFDRRTAKGAPATASPITFGALTAMGGTPTSPGSGCFLTLATGEKVVNAATSIAGNSYFGTNRPSATSSSTICSPNLGLAKTYEMPMFCLAASGSVVSGGGLPPSPVSGIVAITKDDGTTVQVPFVIGAPNARGSAIEASRLRPTIDSPRKRRYWFQETQR